MLVRHNVIWRRLYRHSDVSRTLRASPLAARELHFAPDLIFTLNLFSHQRQHFLSPASPLTLDKMLKRYAPRHVPFDTTQSKVDNTDFCAAPADSPELFGPLPSASHWLRVAHSSPSGTTWALPLLPDSPVPMPARLERFTKSLVPSSTVCENFSRRSPEHHSDQTIRSEIRFGGASFHSQCPRNREQRPDARFGGRRKSTTIQ